MFLEEGERWRAVSDELR